MRRAPGDRVSTTAIDVIDPPTRDEIARRAYDLYLQRHGEHGHDLDDWLHAEQQLIEERRQEALAV